MAIAVVRAKQNGTAAGSPSLTLTEEEKAVASNILGCFVMQANSITNAPSMKDNIGTAGWSTANATKAAFAATKWGVYFFLKTAVGGEKVFEPTAGSGGVVQGVVYFELSGASETIDTIVNKDNDALALTHASASYSTTDVGDIILACVGLQNSSGTIKAWKGTPLLTNVATATGRAYGGYGLPGVTETAQTVEGEQTNSREGGTLLVALKPAVVGEQQYEMLV